MKKKKTNKYTLLGANYASERFFEPINDGLYFRLAPRTLPKWKIILGFILFQIFGFGLGAFLYSKGNAVRQITPHISTYMIPPIFTIILFIAYTLIMYFLYRNQQQKGDLLAYKIKDQIIKLPREKIEIPVSEVYMQVVTGWITRNQNKKVKVSELQLVLKDNPTQRWAIMGSASSFKNAFDYIIGDIRNSIPIEIKK